jgi:phenylalanyl-tRNA synthetase alpha chain
MTPEERQTMGPALNGLKDGSARRRFRRAAQGKELARRLEEERLDVTLPVRPSPSRPALHRSAR